MASLLTADPLERTAVGHALSVDGPPAALPARARHAGYVRAQKGVYGRVAQSGWASLPPNLVKTILEMALPDTLTEYEIDSLASTTANHQVMHDRLSLLLVVKKKGWLEEVKRVCRGWRDAADAQPFWETYKHRLTTSHVPNPNVNPFLAPQRSHSASHAARPQRVTALTEARRGRCPECAICLLYGHRKDVQRAAPIETAYGIVHACRTHREPCTSCLRPEGAPYKLNGLQYNFAELRFVTRGDIDKDGKPRVEGDLCLLCRRNAIEHFIGETLATVARGTPVCSLNPSQLAYLPSYRHYVLRSLGTARQQAVMAVEEVFLDVHTTWAKLIPFFRELQAFYHEMRDVLHNRPMVDWEEVRLGDLLDCIYGTDGYSYQNFHNEVINLARHPQVFSDADLDVEEVDTEETDDLTRLRFTRFTPLFRSRLADLAIKQWAADRVRLGWWVSPEDELQQLVKGMLARTGKRGDDDATGDDGDAPADTHTPFEVYDGRCAAIGPAELKPPGSHHLDLRNGYGILHLQPAVQSPSMLPAILPSPRLVTMMSHKYRYALARAVIEPLRNVVALFKAEHVVNRRDQAAWDRAAAKCAKLDVRELIFWLRQAPAWQPGVLASWGERARRAEVQAAGAQDAATQRRRGGASAAASAAACAGESTTAPASPTVQLVSDAEPMDLDYGIEVVSEEPMEDEPGSDGTEDLVSIDEDQASVESEEGANCSSPPVSASKLSASPARGAASAPERMAQLVPADKKRKEAADDDSGPDKKRERSDPSTATVWADPAVAPPTAAAPAPAPSAAHAGGPGAPDVSEARRGVADVALADADNAASASMDSRISSAESARSSDSAASGASSSVAPFTPHDSPVVDSVAAFADPLKTGQTDTEKAGWAGHYGAAAAPTGKATEEPAFPGKTIAVPLGSGGGASGEPDVPTQPPEDVHRKPHSPIAAPDTSPAAAPALAPVTVAAPAAPAPPARASSPLASSSISDDSIYDDDDDDDAASTGRGAGGGDMDTAIDWVMDDWLLPYVPPHDARLGPGTEEVLRDEWRRARDALDVCVCRVCRRP